MVYMLVEGADFIPGAHPKMLGMHVRTLKPLHSSTNQRTSCYYHFSSTTQKMRPRLHMYMTGALIFAVLAHIPHSRSGGTLMLRHSEHTRRESWTHERKKNCITLSPFRAAQSLSLRFLLETRTSRTTTMMPGHNRVHSLVLGVSPNSHLYGECMQSRLSRCAHGSPVRICCAALCLSLSAVSRCSGWVEIPPPHRETHVHERAVHMQHPTVRALLSAVLFMAFLCMELRTRARRAPIWLCPACSSAPHSLFVCAYFCMRTVETAPHTLRSETMFARNLLRTLSHV